jgi:glutathionylspermidine synthase
MNRANIKIHGDILPVYLKPFFIHDKDKEHLSRVTATIMSALEKIVTAYFQNNKVADAIDIRGRVNDYLSVDHGYVRSIVAARLDAFFDTSSNKLKVIEFNCDDPSSMGENDVIQTIFQANTTMKALAVDYMLEHDRLTECFKHAVMATFSEFCKRKGTTIKKLPFMVVSCSRNSAVKTDIDHIVNNVRQQGVDVCYADPRDLVYDGRKLHFKGKEVDILYRDNKGDIFRDETKGGLRKKVRNTILRASRGACSTSRMFNALLKRSYFGHAEDILRAYKDGAVCLINPFSALITSQKSSLALLHDKRFRDILDDDERHVIDEHVPWSAFMKARTITFKGETIQLAAFVKDNKDEFVLKPVSGFGGKGVLIGKDILQGKWEWAVDRACSENNDYIVQEFVTIPQEEFPAFENGLFIGFKKKNINFNLWAFNGEFGGAFVRISHMSVINVSQGGGLTPVYYVKGKRSS